MVSHHLAVFGGRWSRKSGDIRYLICKMTSKDYLMEGSCDFMSRISSCYATKLPNLVTKSIVVVKI